MKKQSGFTLIEVIISIGIFAILGYGSYKVVNGLSMGRDTLKNNSEYLRQVARTIRIINADFTQIADRNIVDESGEIMAAFMSGNDKYLVEFTRMGVRNPLMNKRSEVERIAYGYEEEISGFSDTFSDKNNKIDKTLVGDGKRGYLVRYVWPVLDRGSDIEPHMQILISGVKGLEFEYLNEDRVWDKDWPPLSSKSADSELPFAIRIKIDTERYGLLERLFQIRKLPKKP